MIIARQKRQENIAEHLLYMFQVEDAIRANGFSMEMLEKTIIIQFKQPEKTMNEIRQWYADLTIQMLDEDIKEKGHLQSVKNTISELVELHHLLVKNNDLRYNELYISATPNILLLKEKSNKNLHDIEICLNALYMFLMLRLQKKSVNQMTLEGLTTLSNLLAYLSRKHKDLSTGKFEPEVF